MTGTYALPALTLVIYASAAICALRAMRTARTPQGAVGWVVFLATLPVLGVPAYLLFGAVDHSGYAEARQAADAALGARHKALAQRTDSAPRLRVFERLAGRPTERGNGVDLLIDGEATYAAFHAAITGAQHYLLVQFYIIRDDAVGQALKMALIERARAGVRVYVLHHAFRGVGLPARFVRELRAAGVEIRAPRGPRRPLGRFQVNYRNHRKVLIADGTVAFTGGLNVGEEHLGRDPKLGQWRDTHARLHGPLVGQLQEGFVADWYWSSKHDIGGTLHWHEARDPRDVRGLVVAPSPTDRLETGNLYFCAMAGAARYRLWITTPYFVPDTTVLAALKLAALRGVDVRVLVPHRPDHYLPWLAAFAYFDELREAGGEIWRYDTGFNHQKVVLVDDDLVSIGTVNLDIRSGLLNFEQTAVFEDAPLAHEVETMLMADFARAHRMERWLHQQPAWLRLAGPATRLLAPLL